MDSFDELTEATLRAIVEFGIKSRTVIMEFKRYCRQLSKYLESKESHFSREIGLDWLAEVWEDDGRQRNSTYVRNASRRRSVLLLADCQEGRLDGWRIYPKKQAQAPAGIEFASLIELHCRQMEAEGKAEATITFAAYVARDFLIFLEDCGSKTVDSISAESIVDYFCQPKFAGRTPGGVRAFAYRLRIFIRFLEEEGHLPEGLHLAVPRGFMTIQAIVSVLPDEVVEGLLVQAGLADGLEIRNKAMMLLALRLGLRRSDILGLRLGDIQWQNEQISLVQKKTGVPVVLPLLPDVGNALMDYILNKRPASDDDAVFVRAYAPHRQLTSAAGLVPERCATGVEQGGFHILRRTFATRMLRNGVPRSVISASLGQLAPNSSEAYLANDEARMRECAIGMAGIECGREDLQ